jgi:hypothetical protein
MSKPISIVTIYNSPTDMPGKYVARRFYGTFATSDSFANDNLGPVRDWARRQLTKFNNTAPIRIERCEDDLPHIVEVWL